MQLNVVKGANLDLGSFRMLRGMRSSDYILNKETLCTASDCSLTFNDGATPPSQESNLDCSNKTPTDALGCLHISFYFKNVNLSN